MNYQQIFSTVFFKLFAQNNAIKAALQMLLSVARARKVELQNSIVFEKTMARLIVMDSTRSGLSVNEDDARQCSAHIVNEVCLQLHNLEVEAKIIFMLLDDMLNDYLQGGGADFQSFFQNELTEDSLSKAIAKLCDSFPSRRIMLTTTMKIATHGKDITTYLYGFLSAYMSGHAFFNMPGVNTLSEAFLASGGQIHTAPCFLKPFIVTSIAAKTLSPTALASDASKRKDAIDSLARGVSTAVSRESCTSKLIHMLFSAFQADPVLLSSGNVKSKSRHILENSFISLKISVNVDLISCYDESMALNCFKEFSDSLMRALQRVNFSLEEQVIDMSPDEINCDIGGRYISENLPIQLSGSKKDSEIRFFDAVTYMENQVSAHDIQAQIRKQLESHAFDPEYCVQLFLQLSETYPYVKEQVDGDLVLA